MYILAKLLWLVALCTVGVVSQGCVSGILDMDLTSPSAVSSLSLSGVTVIQKPSSNPNADYNKMKCSANALLKVNFQKLTNDEEKYPVGCLKVACCGRRMLKVTMTLSPGTRAGHMFNFGDSSTNNGYAGDAGTQSNDAELHGTFPSPTLWSHDKCATSSLSTFTNLLASGTTTVTAWISNEYLRIQTDNGFQQRICHECLWSLNGQTDTEGPKNEDVYLAFNRVVANSARYGVGICKVAMSWECDCLSGVEPYVQRVMGSLQSP